MSIVHKLLHTVYQIGVGGRLVNQMRQLLGIVTDQLCQIADKFVDESKM